ncbi:hypothetical protein ACFX19_028778 [Malus domestica]
MATTPALTLHLSRLARHFPFSSSSLPTPPLFPRARLILRPRDLPFRSTCSFSICNFSRRFSVSASTTPGLSDDGLHDERYDVIVVGGGHAGCEAAIASAHLGAKILLLTLNIDRIAWQPCNPAVGGPAKSQLVHEVDALGGEIGKISDRCYLQKRVLNASRGPAVRALRAQTDKREYAMEMRKIVERQVLLYLSA